MPVITISRMFGAGGSEVARTVADGLEWQLLDNAFVEAVAARLGTTPQIVEAVEERVPSLAERIADAFAFGSPEIVPAPALISGSGTLPPSEVRVLEVTKRVIEEAVARGPVVLVGRGAQQALASRTDALHVLCCAPRDAAIERVMARERVSREQAQKLVDETNKQRSQYVRRHWHREWLAPENYHACLNTAWLGIEGAAQLVIGMARSRLG
jgi:cytidylate kinase